MKEKLGGIIYNKFEEYCQTLMKIMKKYLNFCIKYKENSIYYKVDQVAIWEVKIKFNVLIFKIEFNI